MGILAKIILIILILSLFFEVKSIIKKGEEKKSFEELREEAVALLNALGVDEEQKKKMIYAINTNKKHFVRMQDPLKFMLSKGLKL